MSNTSYKAKLQDLKYIIFRNVFFLTNELLSQHILKAVDVRNGLAVKFHDHVTLADPRVFYPDYKAGRGEERQWGTPDRKAASEVAARLAPTPPGSGSADTIRTTPVSEPEP